MSPTPKAHPTIGQQVHHIMLCRFRDVSLGFPKALYRTLLAVFCSSRSLESGCAASGRQATAVPPPEFGAYCPVFGRLNFSAQFGVGELDRSKPGPGLWFRPQEVASELPTNQPGGCVSQLGNAPP